MALAVPAIWAGCSQRQSADSEGHSASRCRASPVHYERFTGPGPSVRTLPWVAAEPRSVGLVGHLFYYGPPNPWAKRHLLGWRIYAGGKSPDKRINMKILWSAPSPISDAHSLIVRGTRSLTLPASLRCSRSGLRFSKFLAPAAGDSVSGPAQ
jgi:hypothetical protein